MEESLNRARSAQGLPRGRRAVFACVVLASTLALAEVGARAVDIFTVISVDELRDTYQVRRDWRLGKSWPLQRGDYPYLPFVPNPDHPDVNELGFRGRSFAREKPPDTYRIICLGGSTTWNGYPVYLEQTLRDDFAQRGLDLQVINGGNQCWTSMESLISLITRGLPLEPDAIVVYHAINDAIFAFAENARPDYTHLRQRFEKDDPLIWDYLPTLLDHSAAFTGFRAVFERNVGRRGIGIVVTKEPPPGTDRSYGGVEPYRQNITTLLSVAQARGIEVFLCTQIFNREFRYRFERQRQWADAVDDVNDVTRALADQWQDVHVIDAADALPGDNNWMTDYCHFTEEGKSRLARFMADRIRPHIPTLAAKWARGCDRPPCEAEPAVLSATR